MSVQIKCEAVTKEPRSYKGALNWGVKLPGDGGWVTLYREARPTKGEVIDVNITERRGNNGQSYKDCFPVMPPLAPPQPTQDSALRTQDSGLRTQDSKPPKQITWDDYRELMKAAHGVALVLEPDETGHHEVTGTFTRIDRSTARAAIMNTAMIAYSNGKFIVPKDDEGYLPPPFETDDIPPF